MKKTAIIFLLCIALLCSCERNIDTYSKDTSGGVISDIESKITDIVSDFVDMVSNAAAELSEAQDVSDISDSESDTK